MLYHCSVFAKGLGWDREFLSRLAPSEGTPVVFHKEIWIRDPICVTAEGSCLESAQVSGTFNDVCPWLPQRGDVVIGQIYIITKIHGNDLFLSLSVAELAGHREKQQSPTEGRLFAFRQIKEGKISIQEHITNAQTPRVYSLTGVQSTNKWQ